MTSDKDGVGGELAKTLLYASIGLSLKRCEMVVQMVVQMIVYTVND